MRIYQFFINLIVLLLILGGCLMLAPLDETPPALPTPVFVATNTPALLTAYGWTDENAVMSGICFEAAYDAAGQVFVLRSAIEHIRFYGMADHSRLCRRAVTRHPFDFSGGRVLAGLWSAGIGCTARHDVLEVARDDSAKTLHIRLRFITEGDCPYELARPFWIGLDGVGDYDISISVER